MDVPLYDVYLTGKLADGVTPTLAAQRLATLFKSTPEAMAGLITGKAQLLKRGVDKNTALKYRDALQNAGCEIAFKAQTINAVNEKPINSAETTSAAPRQTSAIAQPASTPLHSDLQLVPAGGDLLRPDERHAIAAVTVDTAHLSLAPASAPPITACLTTF